MNSPCVYHLQRPTIVSTTCSAHSLASSLSLLQTSSFPLLILAKYFYLNRGFFNFVQSMFLGRFSFDHPLFPAKSTNSKLTLFPFSPLSCLCLYVCTHVLCRILFHSILMGLLVYLCICQFTSLLSPTFSCMRIFKGILKYAISLSMKLNWDV